MTQKIHRLPDVIAAVGLRRSSIYAAVAAGTFPSPVKLGRRAVGWRDSDITTWLVERPLCHPDLSSQSRTQVGGQPSNRDADQTTRQGHR